MKSKADYFYFEAKTKRERISVAVALVPRASDPWRAERRARRARQIII
ncbi:hypothetical protein [Sorangium sp. So ce590]